MSSPEVSLSIKCLFSLNCELLHLDSVERVLSQQKCHVPSLGTRRSTAWMSEMQVLMLQHGDFFENLSVSEQLFLVKASLLVRSFMTLKLVLSPNISGDLFVFRASFFSWRESVSVILLSRPFSRCKNK